jgi:hypothetical protein
MAAHEPTIIPRNVGETWFIGKGWKSEFTCPVCGRSARFALNFLGGRDVVCDGVKFTKPRREEVR